MLKIHINLYQCFGARAARYFTRRVLALPRPMLAVSDDGLMGDSVFGARAARYFTRRVLALPRPMLAVGDDCLMGESVPLPTRFWARLAVLAHGRYAPFLTWLQVARSVRPRRADIKRIFAFYRACVYCGLGLIYASGREALPLLVLHEAAIACRASCAGFRAREGFPPKSV